MNLADWFPDEDHRFYMRFDRGSVGDFFKPRAAHAKVLAERRGWLRTAAPSYMALQAEGIPLLEETLALARNEQTLSAEALVELSCSKSPVERCRILGESWEPDFVLLHPNAEGVFHVSAGCVCFPSSWSLPEKMGHPMDFVHGPVPGLNAALGKQINSFLGKMKPGLAWQRMNWSLSRSAELNQHPGRNLPVLDDTIAPEEIYLRLEHQVLVKLPNTQGVLFGIHITSDSLMEVKKNPAVARGLARALKTMAEPMADYKKILSCRGNVACFLES